MTRRQCRKEAPNVVLVCRKITPDASLLTMLMSMSTRKMPLLIDLAEVMSWTTGPGVETY